MVGAYIDMSHESIFYIHLTVTCVTKFNTRLKQDKFSLSRFEDLNYGVNKTNYHLR